MKLPQLSLRDLFWLVTLVAMGCGWWVERDRLRDRISELEKLNEVSVRGSLIQKLKQRLPSQNDKEFSIRSYGGGNYIEIIPIAP